MNGETDRARLQPKELDEEVAQLHLELLASSQ
jgi:hypothetical protein